MSRRNLDTVSTMPPNLWRTSNDDTSIQTDNDNDNDAGNDHVARTLPAHKRTTSQAAHKASPRNVDVLIGQSA